MWNLNFKISDKMLSYYMPQFQRNACPTLIARKILFAKKQYPEVWKLVKINSSVLRPAIQLSFVILKITVLQARLFRGNIDIFNWSTITFSVLLFIKRLYFWWGLQGSNFWRWKSVPRWCKLHLYNCQCILWCGEQLPKWCLLSISLLNL